MDFIVSGDFIRVILAVTGVAMLVFTVMSLARRMMNETFCLAWSVLSLALILAGILVHPTHWTENISIWGLVIIFIIFFGLLYAGFFVSTEISKLARQNQELAIQVSLLNEENMRLLKRVSKMADVDVRDI